MKKMLGAGICLAALSGCATGPTTPYKVPQVMIEGASTDDAKIHIVQSCVNGGGAVEENTPSQMVCSKPFDDSFDAMMYRAMFTPKYATRPDVKARYSFTQSGQKLFITIDMFLQFQTAFGQMNRQPIRNSEVASRAQRMLNDIKAQVEGPAIAAAAPPSTHMSSEARPAAATAVSATAAPAVPIERDPAKRCDACKTLSIP